MFNNTSTIKTQTEDNNNQKVILSIPINNRNAKIEMSGDEWRNISDKVGRTLKNPYIEKSKENICLDMMFYGRRANLSLSEKELKSLCEIILELSDDNPKRISDNVVMEMNHQNRPARVEMSKSEMARWLCLVESIDLIEKKCGEFNVNMSDDFWIQPIAIQKYMDSRFETMLDEVNHHEFGIDTKKANLDILKRKKYQEDTSEQEDEEADLPEIQLNQLSRTS